MRKVEEATRAEIERIEWARRAVSAAGEFPELPSTEVLAATAVGAADGVAPSGGGSGGGSGSGGGGGGGGGGAGGDGGDGALSDLVKWVCIRVPRGGVSRQSVLMDTPYGRFAVLVPAGLPPGTPLLVPVPASGAPTQIGTPPTADRALEGAKEAQLRDLLRRGFSASEAAAYCDGVSPVEELAELIRSEGVALEAADGEVGEAADGDGDGVTEPLLPTPRAGGASSFCVVS